jgi:hypothetical protein
MMTTVGLITYSDNGRTVYLPSGLPSAFSKGREYTFGVGFLRGTKEGAV